MEKITEEDIDGLQLFDAVDLCKKLKLDIAKCKDINEIRDCLKKKLNVRIILYERSAVEVMFPYILYS